MKQAPYVQGEFYDTCLIKFNHMNWMTILSFTYPHDAHLAKAKLESEGIEVYVKDEMTVQAVNFYSNAIGGVKLLVEDTEYEKAHNILIELGYLNEQKTVPNKFLNRINKATSRFPLLGKARLELRLIILVALALAIIVFPFAFLTS